MRFALGKRPALLGAVLFVLIIAACFGFSLVFSGRGAYLHTGAIIGTIMVGNVFRIIMPAQRQLVAAIEKNETLIRSCRPRVCCVRATTTTSPCRCCSS